MNVQELKKDKNILGISPKGLYNIVEIIPKDLENNKYIKKRIKKPNTITYTCIPCKWYLKLNNIQKKENEIGIIELPETLKRELEYYIDSLIQRQEITITKPVILWISAKLPYKYLIRKIDKGMLKFIISHRYNTQIINQEIKGFFEFSYKNMYKSIITMHKEIQETHKKIKSMYRQL